MGLITISFFLFCSSQIRGSCMLDMLLWEKKITSVMVRLYRIDVVFLLATQKFQFPVTYKEVVLYNNVRWIWYFAFFFDKNPEDWLIHTKKVEWQIRFIFKLFSDIFFPRAQILFRIVEWRALKKSDPIKFRNGNIHSVLVSFDCQLKTVQCHLRKERTIKELVGSDWSMGISVWHFNDWQLIDGSSLL